LFSGSKAHSYQPVTQVRPKVAKVVLRLHAILAARYAVGLVLFPQTIIALLSSEPLGDVGAELTCLFGAALVMVSLNQMKLMLDVRMAEVADVMLLNPLEVNRWLNHTPVSARGEGFWFADEAMLARVAAL